LAARRICSRCLQSTRSTGRQLALWPEPLETTGDLVCSAVATVVELTRVRTTTMAKTMAKIDLELERCTFQQHYNIRAKIEISEFKRIRPRIDPGDGYCSG
jgi:hypothetical protein